MPEDRTEELAELHRSFGGDIRSYLRRRLSLREEVDDLTQETFARAARVKDWRRVDSPRNYLIRIAQNLFRDLLRQRQHSIVDSDPDIDGLETAGLSRSPEEELSTQREFDSLCGAIMRLTPKVRQAFVLNKFHGYTYEETGRAMGISSRTVEKHIARGLAQCRYHLLQQRDPRACADGADGKVVSLAARRRAGG